MATKRRAEARWIESRSRWQINVQCDGVRKTFVSSTPKRAGKREVEEKADHWLETFDTQQRFAQAWAAYMEDKRKSVGASSYQRYQSAEAHIKPRIPPAKYIDRIAIYDWQKIIDEVAEDGSSKANLDVIRLLIVGFTDYARRRGWECRELHAGDLNTDAGKAKKARRALNKGELTSLMALDYRDTYLAFAFKFMVLTGIRRGEMMGLEWSDIIAAESKMHIARAINALGETTSGKTENAARTVPLTKAALDVLEAQRKALARAGIIAPYVFPGVFGGKLNVKNVEYEWKRVKKNHGVNTVLHELRHTYISIVKADVPLEALKMMIGHSANFDTIPTYGHEIDGEAQRTALMVEEAFKRVL